MVPIGSFERVMPLDLMPTFLLRALLMGQDERAEKLGAWSWMKTTWPCAPWSARARPNTARCCARP
jgi:hypothetical protein